jgi:hypothetical protein
MSTPSRSAGGRVTRAITVVAALAVCAYAVSDHPMYGGGAGFGMTQRAIFAVGVLLGLTALLPLHRNKQALLAFASCLFTLAIAEIGGEALLGPRYRTAVERDPEYIFKLRPNSWGEHVRYPANGGQRVLVRVNADGYRGDELRPRTGQKRIVVYGDSFIHALCCELEDTFTKQLERDLAGKLKADVEVINAGISSFGPDQIMLRMKRELPNLQPDLVVVSLYAGNDYGDLLRNKLFRLEADGSLRRNAYVLSDEIREGFELSRRESILVRALRTEFRNLMRDRSIYASVQGGTDSDAALDPDAALMDLWLRQAFEEYEEFVVRGDDVVTNVYQDQYSADVSVVPSSDSARYRVRFMDAVLGRIASIAKAHGVPLILLIIPSPIDVAPSYDYGRVDRMRYPEYTPDNLTGRLQEIAERRGMAFVNLYDVFVKQDANELYFHGGDDHWNEAGQKLAAEVMADYVVQRGVLGAATARAAGR